MSGEFDAAARVAAAALGGLAVGVERQRSGHASGPARDFAGVRTFTLLGALAGLSGWLSSGGHVWPAALLLGAAGGLVIAAYAAASRHDVDGTTEVAALVVLAAGFLAGIEQFALASGVVATTVLVLVEKSRLHALVRRLNDAEMRAVARFAVMAVVILPLLPEGPYGPFGGVRPRQLWALVLLFAGLGFAGYVARKLVGGSHGPVLTGVLGGLVSSTQVTLAHARASRDDARLGMALACGALAASTILFARTLFAAALLDAALATALLPYLAAPFACGLVASGLSLRRRAPAAVAEPPPTNPLQLGAALQMALLFQAVLTLVYAARAAFGDVGLLASAALVGLTDVDAVTVSMARMPGADVAAAAAARAVAVGILSNTLLKLVLAAAIGRGSFRVATAAGLAAISVAVGAMLLLLAP